MKVIANTKTGKYCAFCSHWYEPTKSVLESLMSRNMFKIDNTQTRKCKIKAINTQAMSTCSKFKSKF